MEYEELTRDLPVSPVGKWELGLDNIRQLMAVFDNPQDKLPYSTHCWNKRQGVYCRYDSIQFTTSWV